MSDIHLLYTPCKTLAEAHTIGTTIVEEKLAACVNIIKDVESIYQWEGKLEQSDEVMDSSVSSIMIDALAGVFHGIPSR